jgi:hypothetical protein
MVGGMVRQDLAGTLRTLRKPDHIQTLPDTLTPDLTKQYSGINRKVPKYPIIHPSIACSPLPSKAHRTYCAHLPML